MNKSSRRRHFRKQVKESKAAAWVLVLAIFTQEERFRALLGISTGPTDATRAAVRGHSKPRDPNSATSWSGLEKTIPPMPRRWAAST